MPTTQAKIRQTALNCLSRRDHSQYELTQKLKKHHYPPDEIAAVINSLIETKLIDDARFSEHYIRCRRNKGYGPERIAMELQVRGIADEIIAESLQITDNDWFIEAHKVWHKRFKGKLPDNVKDQAKQARFLHYRGFASEHIKRILFNIK